jgi:hypothetical protein
LTSERMHLVELLALMTLSMCAEWHGYVLRATSHGSSHTGTRSAFHDKT